MDRRELLGWAGIGTGALILGGVAVDPVAAAQARAAGRGCRSPAAGASRRGSPRAPRTSARSPSGPGSKVPRATGAWCSRWPGTRAFAAWSPAGTCASAPSRDNTVETRLRSRRLSPGSEYFYRFETRSGSSPVGSFRTAPPGRLARAGPDRLLLLPGLPGGLLRRPPRDRRGGRRPRRLPRATTSTSATSTRARARTRWAPTTTARCRRCPSTAPSTSSTSPTPTCGRCTPRTRSSAPGTTTRWRTTTPAAARARRPSRSARAVRGAPPGGLPGLLRVHAVHARARPTPSRGHDLYRRLPLGANAELFMLDERRYRDDQPCGDELFVPCPEAESEPRTFLGRSPARVAQARPAQLGRHLEADRQPADDHGARPEPRARRSTRTPGTATASSGATSWATSPPTGSAT